ncbi:hypothetical protein ACHAWX_004840 [Stephanocyclus meneghinianus]
MLAFRSIQNSSPNSSCLRAICRGQRLSSIAKAMPSNSNSVRPSVASITRRETHLSYGRSTFTTSNNSAKKQSTFRFIWNEVKKSPLQYFTIPSVAAFVGLTTNWMGVKMLFYPIEYTGTEWYRESPYVPYGIIGWQGVVPCKTEKMAARLVHIVTERLLTVEEAFGRLDPNRLAQLLLPIVEDELLKELPQYYGEMMIKLIRPVLPHLLGRVMANLQREIDGILDLKSVVLEAFVGRVELDFLIESGLGFGFILGLFQMMAWAVSPKPWTLPVAGAVVGYVTNWVAIKLLFDPAEPVDLGPIVVQGLFESRQKEVSEEFGKFMEGRVLHSASLLESLARDGRDGELYSFLRRQLPYPVPEFVLDAAVRAVTKAATSPKDYPDLHQYMTSMLDIEKTLSDRLQLLPPKDFEDLLHPVFQEDEIILIAVGGVLGAIAGLMQTRLGWGGPGATLKAAATVFVVSVTSWGYFIFKEVIETPEEVYIEEQEFIVRPVAIKRRNTLVKVAPEVIPEWLDFGDRYQ